MLVARVKHKHVDKNILIIDKNIEKGLSNKEAATKYNVPKNTISTWVKDKDKILSRLEEGQNVKDGQKLRGAAPEALG